MDHQHGAPQRSAEAQAAPTSTPVQPFSVERSPSPPGADPSSRTMNNTGNPPNLPPVADPLAFRPRNDQLVFSEQTANEIMATEEGAILTPSRLRTNSWCVGGYAVSQALLTLFGGLLLAKLNGSADVSWWVVFAPLFLSSLVMMPVHLMLMVYMDEIMQVQVGPPPSETATVGMHMQYEMVLSVRARSHLCDHMASLITSLAHVVTEVIFVWSLSTGQLDNVALRAMLAPAWVGWAAAVVLNLMKDAQDRSLVTLRDIFYVFSVMIALKVDDVWSITWKMVFALPWIYFLTVFLIGAILLSMLMLAQAWQRLHAMVLPVSLCGWLLSNIPLFAACAGLVQVLDGDDSLTVNDVLAPAILAIGLMATFTGFMAYGLRLKERQRQALLAQGAVWTAFEGMARRMHTDREAAARRYDNLSDEEINQMVQQMMEGKAKPGQLIRVGANLYKHVSDATLGPQHAAGQKPHQQQQQQAITNTATAAGVQGGEKDVDSDSAPPNAQLGEVQDSAEELTGGRQAHRTQGAEVKGVDVDGDMFIRAVRVGVPQRSNSSPHLALDMTELQQRQQQQQEVQQQQLQQGAHTTAAAPQGTGTAAEEVPSVRVSVRHTATQRPQASPFASSALQLPTIPADITPPDSPMVHPAAAIAATTVDSGVDRTDRTDDSILIGPAARAAAAAQVVPDESVVVALPRAAIAATQIAQLDSACRMGLPRPRPASATAAAFARRPWQLSDSGGVRSLLPGRRSPTQQGRTPSASGVPQRPRVTYNGGTGSALRAALGQVSEISRQWSAQARAARAPSASQQAPHSSAANLSPRPSLGLVSRGSSAVTTRPSLGVLANNTLSAVMNRGLLGISTPNQVAAEDVDADDTTCVICYDAEASCVFLECGHGGFCTRCARLLFVRPPGECPACRRPIDQIVELEALPPIGEIANVKG